MARSTVALAYVAGMGEALIDAVPQAMRVLTSPLETGSVTLALHSRNREWLTARGF